MSKLIYALITKECNLSCPHCDIKNIVDDYNEELFTKTLEEEDCKIILFGGEITVRQERLFDLCNNSKIFKKIESATTNLVILNDELISLYKKINSIATSWNPNRFNPQQYQLWINNLDRLAAEYMTTSVLITLTDDLFDIPIDEFMSIVGQWNPTAIHGVRFECLVDEHLTPDYYEKSDQWLCEIYKRWNFKFPLLNINLVKNYYHDCTNKYTLWPNGTLEKGCPHHLKPTMPEECYLCERANICRPCQLQQYCSYPKEFARLVHENEKEGD